MFFDKKIKLDKEALYKINEGFELREVVGKKVVVYMGKDEAFNGIIRLNEEGEEVWKLLLEGSSPSLVTSSLEEIYDADHDTIEANVLEVMNNLLTENVIHKCEK
ncbi:MAG: PqqD family protein [Butyrivibrio sp.]|nr:PqqD family protein [Butyrivibrio sp.]